MLIIENARLHLRTQIMFKIIKIIAMIVMLLIVLIARTTFAAQEFEYIPGNKIKAKISSSNINRIEFGKIGIAQIIGDDRKYKIIVDNKAQNIFLLPKVQANQTLELALVGFSGDIADLVLESQDIEGQVIRILTDSFYNNSTFFSTSNSSPNSLSDSYFGNLFCNFSNNASHSSIKIQEREIAQMMRSMISGKEGKYYVTRVKRKIDRLRNIGLLIEQDRIYRYGKLIGARLAVTNKKPRKPVYLKESDFSNLFDFCLATSIEKTVLPARSKGFVWVVAKEQDHD